MKNKSGTSKTDTIIDEIQNNIKELTKCINQLIIEQGKLKKALNWQSRQQRQQQTECATCSHTGSTKKKLKIGDRVRVNSLHKNRKGSIRHITGFRDTTQVVITSNQEAEDFAAVWKNNVSIINNITSRCEDVVMEFYHRFQFILIVCWILDPFFNNFNLDIFNLFCIFFVFCIYFFSKWLTKQSLVSLFHTCLLFIFLFSYSEHL